MNFSSKKYEKKFFNRIAKRRPYSQKCCMIFEKEDIPTEQYLTLVEEVLDLLNIDVIKLKAKEADEVIVIMFNVHENDIPKIAEEKRSGTNIRYIEDIMNPQNNYNFPKEWEKYMTWDPTIPAEVLEKIRA